MATTERDQLLERVIRDPAIQLGRPVIRGTRVTVGRIVGALSAGASFAELCEDYGLVDEDIRAALAFAAKTVDETEIHTLPAA